MKVVVFPGVNYTDTSNHQYFLDKITNGLGCDGELFVWEQPHVFPPFSLPLTAEREFFCGVVFDFQRILLHAMEIKVPDADIYIGHSAGSILALLQNKPVVTMASPAVLIEAVDNNTIEDDQVKSNIRSIFKVINENAQSVLNIINRYDLIAYPFNKPNVEDYAYMATWYKMSSYNPISSHTDYWKNDTVINKIISKIKTWKNI